MLVTVTAVVLVINIPFGFWRARVKKLSLPWLLSIHFPIIIAFMLRAIADLGWGLSTFPPFMAAFLLGQFFGGKLYLTSQNYKKMNSVKTICFILLKNISIKKEQIKCVAKTKWHRKNIQALFFVLFIWFILNFIPSVKFLFTVLILFILITLTLRTGLCGWMCPFGTLFERFNTLGGKIESIGIIQPRYKKYKKWIKDNRGLLNKIDKYARYFKYPFLLWTIFSSVYSFRAGHLAVPYVFLVLLTLTLFINRAWCRYACPVGALIGVLGKLSPTIITRDEQKCIKCNRCSRVCSMNIDVAKQKHVKATDCITCLECVDACPIHGALELRVALPRITNRKNRNTSF
ncbi:MAG: hypothetical protein APF76_03415 [Desulfitibacter sp. BRH_c19]|nr:MAG: hypothetical protein APF76_03415 [Desulfitibacter sp. BRH_c19]